MDPNVIQSIKDLGLSDNRLLDLTAINLAIKSMPSDKLNSHNGKQIADDFCKKFIDIKTNIFLNNHKFMQKHRGRSMFS